MNIRLRPIPNVENRFLPDSQAAARYTAQPFQRFEVNIGGVDRSEPELFPQFEGEYLYCERADYPVLINLVSPGKGVQLSQLFRTGTQIKAPFKGLSISHPLVSNLFNSKFNLSLIVGRQRDVEVSNNLGDCAAPMMAAVKSSVTAVLSTFTIFIPPGVRRLRKFSFALTATTVTQANLALRDISSLFVIPSTTIVDSGVSYTDSFTAGYQLRVTATPVTGVFLFEMEDLHIPTNATNIFVTVAGTGLALVASTAPNVVFT